MDEMNLTEFGQRLEAIQKKRHISDRDLSRRLGIAQPNITTIKYYTAKPRLQTMKKYAKALGVDFAELDTANDPMVAGHVKIWMTVEVGSTSRKIRVL